MEPPIYIFTLLTCFYLWKHFLTIVIHVYYMLDTICRIQNASDRAVMVQCIDQKRKILAHITVNVVRLRQKLRCLIDQVCCEHTIQNPFFICFIKLVQSACEQTECSCCIDSLSLALL